jgi:hypothetical protein
MSNNTAICAILGLLFCALCGCATSLRNSRDSNLNTVNAEFFSETGKNVRTVEIPARPGFSFATLAQDEAGSHYQVRGILRQMAEHGFRLEQIVVAFPSGISSFSSLDLEPGQKWGTRSSTTIIGAGYHIWITEGTVKQGASLLKAAIPLNSNILSTIYGIWSTNTIDGPPIPVGTPVYVQAGTDPTLYNSNQEIGPGNIYLEPVGLILEVSTQKPISSTAAANWPTQPRIQLPPNFAASYTNIETTYISGTNRGTISRSVTVLNTNSVSSASSVVTIKALQ